jgi:hypothetical protein
MRGVAPRQWILSFESTYRRLRSCLPKCVLIGEVNYIDYQTQEFSMGNTFNFIMRKRKSFEHERELRAAKRLPRKWGSAS